MNGTVQPWIWALAGDGLPGSEIDHGDGPWDERLDTVQRHGLAAILLTAAEHGRARLDGGTLDKLERRVDAEAVLAVRLEAELARLAPLLDRHSAVVLKGAALAHGVYPDPRLRPFTDLDLLVSGDSIPQALLDFGRVGYYRPRPDPSPGYAARVAKATAIVHESGIVVDLHRTLAAGNPGHRIDVESVLKSRIIVPAGAVSVPAPGWAEQLVEVCVHSVLGDGLVRALSLRDVAQVALHSGTDIPRFLELCRQWDLERVAAIALQAATERLRAVLPAALRGFVDSNRRLHVGVGKGHDAHTATRRLDELRHGQMRRRSTVLRSLIAPTPAFLRWKYGGLPLPTLYWQRWLDLRHRTADAWKAP